MTDSGRHRQVRNSLLHLRYNCRWSELPFEDPTITAAVKKDTPPQKCYIDHTDSWSTNEITINWNAPFAWVTAYLDEIDLITPQEE